MGDEFGAFESIGDRWWSVSSIASGAVVGCQRWNQSIWMWYLLLQSRFEFRPIWRAGLSLVIQLFLLQQEVEANCFLHMPGDQVSTSHIAKKEKCIISTLNVTLRAAWVRVFMLRVRVIHNHNTYAPIPKAAKMHIARTLNEIKNKNSVTFSTVDFFPILFHFYLAFYYYFKPIWVIFRNCTVTFFFYLATECLHVHGIRHWERKRERDTFTIVLNGWIFTGWRYLFFFLISTSSFNCVGETSWCVAGIDIGSAKYNDSIQINRI